MSITRFFTRAFSIYRMIWITSETSELQLVGSFKGHRQQIQIDLVQTIGIAYGRAYKVWLPLGTNIFLEDILTDGDESYTVRGIKKVDYAGGNTHLELTVETNENYASI